MVILKFGGTSVGTGERIEKVALILKQRFGKTGKAVVVLSALGGVTDELIKMSKAASRGDNNYKNLFNHIEEKHIGIVKSLIPVKHQTAALSWVKLTLNELEDVIHGNLHVKE